MPARSEGAGPRETGRQAASFDSARSRKRHPAALPAVLGSVAAQTGIGPVREYQVIQRGYEDLNLYLTTAAGTEYVLKIFSQSRSEAEVSRTLEVLRVAIAAGVRHPRVLAGADGRFLLSGPDGGGWRAVLMHRSAKRSIYDEQRVPTAGELASLLRQVALLHASDYCPPFHLDDWSVDNAPAMLSSVRHDIDSGWRTFIQQGIAEFGSLDRSALTFGLIHGDLTTGNVLVDAAGVELIDYSCANRSPVVYDLAVVIVNLLHESPERIEDRLSTVTAAYRFAGGQLNDADVRALPKVVTVAAAMEYLGAVHERVHSADRTEENQYVEELGLRALRLLAGVAD